MREFPCLGLIKAKGLPLDMYYRFIFYTVQDYILGLVDWTLCCKVFLTLLQILLQNLRQEIAAFSQELRTLSAGAATLGLGTGGDGGIRSSGSGQVSLEFYHKRRKWLFPSEIIPWEVGDTNLY